MNIVCFMSIGRIVCRWIPKIRKACNARAVAGWRRISPMGVTEKSEMNYTVIIYSTCFYSGERRMRKASLNGATFIFMAIGEKLKDSDIWNNAHVLDNRYVLWPHGEFWDVRFMGTHGCSGKWVGIADQPFHDETSAWLSALEHWEAECKNVLRLSGK